ncbi:MAG: response regulator [Chloroflexota bacterium]
MATILTVDDYPTTLKLLYYQLRHNGYQVVTATSASEALQRLEENQIDLAILDIAMPDMDGITLLQQLRADARYRSLPVIMLTASGLDSDRQTAAVQGASAFLNKPVSSWELARVVAECLQQPE